MNYVEQLDEALRQQLAHPWQKDLSGGEKTWFLVFDPMRIRYILAYRKLFQHSTEAAGKRWEELDISSRFGAWMNQHEYAESYFEDPELADTLFEDFVDDLVEDILRRIRTRSVDDTTLLVLTGTESLYGITKLAHVTRRIEDNVPGRLLVFFPGEYAEPHYRFLDARDGWNYLAVPLTPVDRKGS